MGVGLSVTRQSAANAECAVHVSGLTSRSLRGSACCSASTTWIAPRTTRPMPRSGQRIDSVRCRPLVCCADVSGSVFQPCWPASDLRIALTCVRCMVCVCVRRRSARRTSRSGKRSWRKWASLWWRSRCQAAPAKATARPPLRRSRTGTSLQLRRPLRRLRPLPLPPLLPLRRLLPPLLLRPLLPRRRSRRRQHTLSPMVPPSQVGS